MAKTSKPPAQEDLADAVRASAQQIWQAGLGAFVRAQQQDTREFERLVREGAELQRRVRGVDEATGTVGRAAERASRRSTGSWGKLEQVFEERVARALAAIGVPARSEVEALGHRIDELERMVAELGAGGRAGAAAAKPVARKGAARRTAAKKTAAP